MINKCINQSTNQSINQYKWYSRLDGSDGFPGPALLCAMTRYWYSFFSITDSSLKYSSWMDNRNHSISKWAYSFYLYIITSKTFQQFNHSPSLKIAFAILTVETRFLNAKQSINQSIGIMFENSRLKWKKKRKKKSFNPPMRSGGDKHDGSKKTKKIGEKWSRV